MFGPVGGGRCVVKSEQWSSALAGRWPLLVMPVGRSPSRHGPGRRMPPQPGAATNKPHRAGGVGLIFASDLIGFVALCGAHPGLGHSQLEIDGARSLVPVHQSVSRGHFCRSGVAWWLSFVSCGAGPQIGPAFSPYAPAGSAQLSVMIGRV